MKGIRQWLIDTYNGLYVIVLKPHMPSYATVFGVILAMLFGLFWGYVIAPVIYYDGSPTQLNRGGRDQWVQMVAASYTAQFYDDADILRLLDEIEDPLGTVDRLISATSGVVQQSLTNMRRIMVDANGQPLITGKPAPAPAGIVSDLINIVVAIVAVVILALIVSPVWRLLIKGNIVMPIYERLRPKTQEEIEEKKRREENLRLIRETKKREEEMREQSRREAVGNPYGAPIMQKLSIYTKGRNYDDSFAIEDADNNFYGECGATIAKQVNNELAAVELWLFDKEDFVRTLNKILLTPAAYNDPAIRGEMEGRVEDPANDIVVAQPGQAVQIQTDLLLVSFKVLEMTLTPDNLAFAGLTLQVEAWYKPLAGGGARAGMATAVAVPPVTTYTPPMPPDTQRATADAAPTYTPPMYTPTNQPPPAPPPPPPPPRPNYDDDPFGGTGDFTPLNP